MFGDRLKLARKKAGYSLRGLAESLEKEVSAKRSENTSAAK